jgi:dTMP kinase
VLCDRFGDSTLAYQGYGHGLNLDTLRTMLDFATDKLKPDLTLLLDVDVETGLQRKRKEDEWNRLDAYALAFHQCVREGYHELCRQEPERWRVIDAMQPKEAVQLALRQAVMQFLQEKIND